MSYVTGAVIKQMREKRGFTQKDLACRLNISDKTISKWETGRGLPDIALIDPLASQLGVSIAELMSGQVAQNANPAANLLRAGFNVCPVCGNVIFSTGEGSFSCHGITLPRLEAEAPDSAHAIDIQVIDGDYCVQIDHPMTKTHYVSFIAYATTGSMQMEKLYPEQDARAHFRVQGTGRIFAYCNLHGLFVVATPKRARMTGNRLP